MAEIERSGKRTPGAGLGRECSIDSAVSSRRRAIEVLPELNPPFNTMTSVGTTTR